MFKIGKVLKIILLLIATLVFIYILYISSKQDYSVFSPTRNIGRPAKDKPEKSEEEDYMDFINKQPIENPEP